MCLLHICSSSLHSPPVASLRARLLRVSPKNYTHLLADQHFQTISGVRESNPCLMLGKHAYYHCTNSAYGGVGAMDYPRFTAQPVPYCCGTSLLRLKVFCQDLLLPSCSGCINTSRNSCVYKLVDRSII